MTFTMAETGRCGLISGLQCRAFRLAALMDSVIDNLISFASSKLKEKYRLESIPGHPVLPSLGSNHLRNLWRSTSSLVG